MLILGITYFLLGLILLYFGSDWFVSGSEKIAKQFNISNYTIGATIVAIGTSLPEILTSAYASYIHAPGISVGNAIGSCICNIGLVLGLSAIICPIVVNKELMSNILVYVLFIILTAILGIDGFSWVDGLILLLIFLIYLRWTVKNGKIKNENIEASNKNKTKEKDISIAFSSIMLIIGLFSVLVGAELFVNGAVKISNALNIPDKVIGFTLVAVGTSLPELMVSLVAARRKLGSIVIGNVIGSNIANIGGALAIGSLFMHLPAEYIQMAILVVMSILLYLFAKTKKINRWHGVIFLIIYIISLIFLRLG